MHDSQPPAMGGKGDNLGGKKSDRAYSIDVFLDGYIFKGCYA